MRDVRVLPNGPLFREKGVKIMATIKVEGMKCQHCVGNTKKAMEALDGISNVVVDLEKGEVSYDGEASMEEIKAAISAKGFTVVD